MQEMNYEQNQHHVTAFLASAHYRKLSANQQTHAAVIIERFNQFMQQDEHRDDQHWTAKSVKAVMLGEFATDQDVVDRKFQVAVVPVLKAYQQFLQPNNLAVITRTLDENRTTMQDALRRAIAAYHLNDLKQQHDELEQLVADYERKNVVTRFKAKLQMELQFRSEFKRIDVDQEAKMTIVDAFVDAMALRFQQEPQQWSNPGVSVVLTGMLPLDMRLLPEDAAVIVPVIRCLVNYLSATDQITVKHAAQLLAMISDVRPSVDYMASLDNIDRHAATLARMMADKKGDFHDMTSMMDFVTQNQDEVLTYMTWMQPWLDDEQEEFSAEDVIFGIDDDDEDDIELTADELDQLKQQNQETVLELLHQFKQSAQYQELTAGDQKMVQSIVTSVADWMIDAAEEILDDWSPTPMFDVLTYYIPTKTTATVDYFTHVIPVMRQFVTYAIDADAIFLGDQVLEAVNEAADQVVSNSQDKQQWGFAKQLGMQMMEAGIDPSDEQAVQQFITQYNENLQHPASAAPAGKKQPRKVIPFSQKKRGKKKKKKR